MATEERGVDSERTVRVATEERGVDSESGYRGERCGQ